MLLPLFCVWAVALVGSAVGGRPSSFDELPLQNFQKLLPAREKPLGRRMEVQEEASDMSFPMGVNETAPVAGETNQTLIDALKAAGFNATAFGAEWVRFLVPDPRLSSGNLVAFAAYNNTDVDVASVTFKSGFALSMPRGQKLEFANYFNRAHGWGRLVVGPGPAANVYLWLDQALTGQVAQDHTLIGSAANIFADELKAFVTDLRYLFSGSGTASTGTGGFGGSTPYGADDNTVPNTVR